MKAIRIFLYKKFEAINRYLWKEKYYRFGIYFSSIVKAIMFREFFPKSLNYSNLDELVAKIDKSSIPINKNINKDTSKNTNKIKKLFIIKGCYPDFFVNALISGQQLECEIFDFTKMNSLENTDFGSDILEFETKSLLKKISSFDPDVILLGTNIKPLSHAFSTNTISKIRSIYKKKIIGYSGDIYTQENYTIAKNWCTCLDYVLHGEKRLAKNFPLISNLKFIPFDIDPKTFFPEKKKHDFFFSGLGNNPRFPFIFTVKLFSNILGLKANIFIHRKSTNPSLSYDKYTKLIRTSRVTANFSRRSRHIIEVLGGNRIEALASKTLLLAEGTVLKEYLTPYAHFIPFSTVREFIIALKFIKNYPDRVNKIVESGYAIYKTEWSSVSTLDKFESIMQSNDLFSKKGQSK